MSWIVPYFSHSTLMLSFYTDVILTPSIATVEQFQWSYSAECGYMDPRGLLQTDNATTNTNMMTSSNGNIFRATGRCAVTGHRSPVNPAHKSQRCGTLMGSLICAWTNSCVNNRDAGDLRHHSAHHDVIVMATLTRGHIRRDILCA